MRVCAESEPAPVPKKAADELRRLLPVRESAVYLGVGEQTIRDYVEAEILTPVRLPGSWIRPRRKGDGSIGPEIKPADHRLDKLLFDVQDLNELIEKCKRGVA